MSEILEILVAELGTYTNQLQEVWAVDLAAVNHELSRLGLELIDLLCAPDEICSVV